MSMKLKLVGITILSLLFLSPIVLTIVNSFVPTSELLINHHLTIPQRFSLYQYYLLLIERLDYLHMFWNSVIITLCILLGNSLYSIFIGCYLAKAKVAAKKYILLLFIVASIIPYQAIMLPQYILLRYFNFLDKNIGLILPMLFSPLGVLIMYVLCHLVPEELIEAVKLETNSTFNIFQYAIFPTIKGGIVILIIFIFSEAWNIVEPALAIFDTVYKQPLSTLLASLQSEKDIIFAAAVIYMFPSIIIYFFFHEALNDTLHYLKEKELTL